MRSSRNRNKAQASFLIGISTAAHHIEGNNTHSDWWLHEQELTGGVSSGEACNSYSQYKRDRKLLVGLGCNAYRFSIEWSRIEPEQGKFSVKEAKHYQQVIEDLVNAGIEPVVTLHHFTNPVWFENSGGWARSDATQVFLRFVTFVLPYLKDHVKFYTPINEPNVYVGNKYTAAVWHPYEKDFFKTIRVLRNLANAHMQVYQLLKTSNPDVKIGSCVQHVDLVGIMSIWWPVNLILAGIGAFVFNHLFYLFIGNNIDFVGLNFYSTYGLGCTGISLFPKLVPHPLQDGKLQMTSKPDRILTALRSVSRYGKPIMITENGKLTANDIERSQYIKDIFEALRRALLEGMPIFGYLHFTHIDSFEWGLGFGPQFGLYSHNPKTHEIKPKPSSKIFSTLTSSFHHWHQSLNRGKVGTL